MQAYRGAPAAAEDDCERAAVIFAKLDLDLAAADVRWNGGIAAAQRGDVPRALEIFAQVDAEYRRLDVPRPALLLDRIELLLSVPLIEEARSVAAAAVAELRSRGMASDLAEALLALARVALLEGDLAGAAASAAGRAPASAASGDTPGRRSPGTWSCAPSSSRGTRSPRCSPRWHGPRPCWTRSAGACRR